MLWFITISIIFIYVVIFLHGFHWTNWSNFLWICLILFADCIAKDTVWFSDLNEMDENQTSNENIEEQPDKKKSEHKDSRKSSDELSKWLQTTIWLLVGEWLGVHPLLSVEAQTYGFCQNALFKVNKLEVLLRLQMDLIFDS